MAKTSISNAVKQISIKDSQDYSYEKLSNSKEIEKRIDEVHSMIANGKVKNAIVKAGNTDNATISNIKLTEQGEKKVLSAVQNLLGKYGTDYRDKLVSLRTQGSSSITSKSNVNIVPSGSTEVDEPSATKVASDPDKPDELKISLSAEDVYDGTTNAADSYTFDISKLYEDTSDINLKENKYTETLNSGKKLRSEDVIAVTKSGLITQTQTDNYEELSSYRLIMNDYLKQETITDEDEYSQITRENFSDKFFGNDQFHNLDVKDSVATKQKVRYRYLYGFDGIEAAQKTIDNSAGYISSEIDVSDCSYIELSASVTDNVEYSILDGKKEVPILPIGQDKIKNEKLFFGLMPRFDIMNPSDIVVKRDGEVIGISSLQDLQLFLLTNNTNSETGQSSFLREGSYTIDYEPGASAQSYHPDNDRIRIKIIQRNFVDSIPIAIDTLVIRKYGRSNPWALSTYDTDTDYNSADPRN